MNPTSHRRFVRRASPLPVYWQLADQLEREVVASRAFDERAALPSESDLATEFGVSRITVRQALDRLHAKGLIYRQKGRGSYVRSLHVRGFTGLGSFTDEVTRGGHTPSSRVVGRRQVDALPAAMLTHLARPSREGETFLCLSRVRLIDGAPVAYEDAYLPDSMYPDIAGIGFDDVSLYQTMREGWGYEPAWADTAIEPTVADDVLAGHLAVDVGAPVVVAWRVTSTEHDEVLEFVRSVYNGACALTVSRHKIG